MHELDSWTSCSKMVSSRPRKAPLGLNLTTTVVLAMHKGGKRKSDGKRAMSLIIFVGLKVLKEARIIPGDRVDVLFSPDKNHVLIRRDNDSSFSVHKSYHSKSFAKIAITWKEGMVAVDDYTPCESVVVDDRGILIALPTQGGAK